MIAKEDNCIYITNIVEANLLEQILKEENIPHYIRSFNDRAYSGIFQPQKGWGVVEAPDEFRQKIIDIIEQIR